MSKKEKLKQGLLKNPSTFKWDDLCQVLKDCGFVIKNGRGPRTRFYHPGINRVLSYHKPHPGNEVRKYVITECIEVIKELDNEQQ